MRQADFVDALFGLAVRLPDPRVTAIASRLGTPLRVAVCGRRGVGSRTVARALRCTGLVIAPLRNADVVGYVVAEVVKPEDQDNIDAIRPRPLVVVLNKADLAGGADVAAVSERVGVPVVPMAALFAVAALDGRLDDTVWDALQALAAEPADRVGTGRPAPQLLTPLYDTLDRSGIGHALAAVRRGATRAQTQTLLRRLSNVDAVAGRITAAGAAVRYRRLLEAVGQLEALGVGDSRVADFLAGDDTVAARMAAAVDVVEAAGLPVAAGDDPAAHLHRAVRWQRYSRGPVTALHRACGNDIARGSLRLWAATSTPRDAA